MSEIITRREVLMALANGEKAAAFETARNGEHWGPISECTIWDLDSDALRFRRKVEPRLINGFEVPHGLKTLPRGESYYVASLVAEGWYGTAVAGPLRLDRFDARAVERGIAFTEKEDAIAVAKAMCGINPKEQ